MKMITSKQKDDMFVWIKSKMNFDIWYPVKSDEAYEAIENLFLLGIIDECEFNAKETEFRKVNFDFTNRDLFKKKV
jgi:hypothetical protein